MRFKEMANTMLAAVCGLFLLAVFIKHSYRGSLAAEMFYITTEAALIGGIADWFAVTALFKRPLGFPWHTELIPRNRERLIEALAGIVEEELLSSETIRRRIAGVSFVDWFIHWVDNHGGKQFFADLLSRHSADIWDNNKRDALALYLEDVLKKNAKGLELAPQLGNFVNKALKRGKDEQLITMLLDELIVMLQKPAVRQSVYGYLDNLTRQKARSLLEKAIFWLGEQTDSINLQDAADALCDELVALLNDLKDTDHLVRIWLRGRLAEIAANLDNNAVWVDAIENWKIQLIEKIELKDVLAVLVKETASGSYAPAMEWLSRQMDLYWSVFKQDKQAHVWFEARVKYAVYRLIKKEHPLIGRVVKSVLSRFSDADLSRFVEDKAGDDLQWIRINGSIIGGLVGLMMFLFLHFVYSPFIVPVIRSWFG